MILNASVVRDTLKKHVVDIEYRNQDGVKRHGRCTLIPSKLPGQLELEELATDDHILLLWDISSEKWVVVHLDLVVKFTPEV